MAPWLWLALVVVLLAGGLFGDDQGVISGALRGIKSTFTLSPLLIEAATSWVTLGALFGSLAGGELADQVGRRRAALIAGGGQRKVRVGPGAQSPTDASFDGRSSKPTPVCEIGLQRFATHSPP